MTVGAIAGRRPQEYRTDDNQPAAAPARTGRARASATSTQTQQSAGARQLVANRSKQQKASGPREVLGKNPEQARAVQRRLQEFLRSAEVQVRLPKGGSAEAPIPFRMISKKMTFYPSSDVAMERLKGALPDKDFRAVAPSLDRVLAGKGTPQEIRRITQLLVDNDQLDGFRMQAKGDDALALRQMMHNFGLGLDCSGYSHQAICHAKGLPLSQKREGLPPGAREVDRNGAFKGLLKAEPGDWVQLGIVRDAGHKVVVSEHRVYPRGPLPGGIPADFAKGGPLHVYRVQSSWGGGESKGVHGGVQERTWAYNESTNKWASMNQGGSFTISDRPYDHPVDGVYRAPNRKD